MEVRHTTGPPKRRTRSTRTRPTVHVSPDKTCADLTSAVHEVSRQRKATSGAKKAQMMSSVQTVVEKNVVKNHESLARCDWDSIMSLQQGVRRLNNEIKACDRELRDVIARTQKAKGPVERESLRDQGNRMTIELVELQGFAVDLKHIMLSSLAQAPSSGPERVSIDLEEPEDPVDLALEASYGPVISPGGIPNQKETSPVRYGGLTPDDSKSLGSAIPDRQPQAQTSADDGALALEASKGYDPVVTRRLATPIVPGTLRNHGRTQSQKVISDREVASPAAPTRNRAQSQSSAQFCTDPEESLSGSGYLAEQSSQTSRRISPERPGSTTGSENLANVWSQIPDHASTSQPPSISSSASGFPTSPKVRGSSFAKHENSIGSSVGSLDQNSKKLKYQFEEDSEDDDYVFDAASSKPFESGDEFQDCQEPNVKFDSEPSEPMLSRQVFRDGQGNASVSGAEVSKSTEPEERLKEHRKLHSISEIDDATPRDSQDNPSSFQGLGLITESQTPKQAKSRDASAGRQSLSGSSEANRVLSRDPSSGRQSVGSTSEAGSSSEQKAPAVPVVPSASIEVPVQAPARPSAPTKPKSFNTRLTSSTSSTKHAKYFQLYRLRKMGRDWTTGVDVLLNSALPQKEIEQKVRIALKGGTVAEQLGLMKPKRRSQLLRMLEELNEREGEGEGSRRFGWEIASVEDTHVVLTHKGTRDVRAMEVVFVRGRTAPAKDKDRDTEGREKAQEAATEEIEAEKFGAEL